jgi:hypothetical protein
MLTGCRMMQNSYNGISAVPCAYFDEDSMAGSHRAEIIPSTKQSEQLQPNSAAFSPNSTLMPPIGTFSDNVLLPQWQQM